MGEPEKTDPKRHFWNENPNKSTRCTDIAVHKIEQQGAPEQKTRAPYLAGFFSSSEKFDHQVYK